LKTAPVAVQRESFAKDLALGSMYDDPEGIPSVVVVNTKTRERTRLRGQEPSPQGMHVQEAVIADTRRDSYAVVVMGSEKATLRYDEAYLKQMTAGGGVPTTPGPNAGAASERANVDGKPASTAATTTAASAAGSPQERSEMASRHPSMPTPPPADPGAQGRTPPGLRPPSPGGHPSRPSMKMRRSLTGPQAVRVAPPIPAPGQ
jgi:hypothetical protein